MTDPGPLPPPAALGPFVVEFLGRRRGLLTLQITLAGHTVHVFADRGGASAYVSAEIDGRKLARRRKARPGRIWSNDLVVQRWIVAAAAEFDGERPRWSLKRIAQNLNRAGRARMTHESVRRLLWRKAPVLAKRRADFWRVERWKKAATRKKKPENDAAYAAERQAVIAELKRAGLM